MELELRGKNQRDARDEIYPLVFDIKVWGQRLTREVRSKVKNRPNRVLPIASLLIEIEP